MYVIQDWTGKDVCYPLTFKTFEDGWGYIWGELTDRLNLKEDDYQEYYVEYKERS